MAKTYESNEKKKNSKSEEDILSTMKDRFRISSEYYSDNRMESLEDFRFYAGEQWPENIKKERDMAGKPTLQINQVQPFVKQVVNQQKKNRPSINVNPEDSQGKIEIAKVFQAIIKNIENRSMAENAYDTAFNNACIGGEGYFRIVTEYASDMSFDQEIFIRPIDNSFSVLIDPDFHSDFTGIEYAFVFDDISKDEFERLYPDSECASGELFVTQGDDWISENYIRLAEYFYIDYKKIKIVQLGTGDIFLKSDYDKLPEETKSKNKIVKERDSQERIVKWIKTNGHEILESTDFPGEFIPIIPVFANRYVKDGKWVMEGVIRQAKDAQRAYNYWYSCETMQISLAPSAPYLLAKGQEEGFEDMWANLNNDNTPYLLYNPVTSDGKQVGPPQRQQFDPQITAILNAKQAARDDLKAITGIYDPSLGNDQTDASGKAIITRQRQAETGNFLYADNLSKSLKYAGKILLNIIPIVYDTQRVVRIKGGVNQEDELVVINAFDEKEPVFLEVGKYDIDISIGPYGENQRNEATETMLALMQIDPSMAQIMADIFVGKLDFDGAKEISERLKIMLPPQLQGEQELPPEIQAQVVAAQQQYEQQIQQQQMQLQAMQQLISDLTSKVNIAEAEVKNKTADIESKERINAENNRVKLIIEQMKQDANDSRLAFQEEMAFTNMKQQGKSNIPTQGDSLVLSGVNDPITEEEQGVEEDGLSPQEQQDLLAKLQNFTPESTRM